MSITMDTRLLSPSSKLSTISEECDESDASPVPNNTVDQYSLESNFRVAIRVRPPVERERRRNYITAVSVHGQDRLLTIGEDVSRLDKENDLEELDSGNFPTYSFAFDKIYDQPSTQEQVYDDVGRPTILSTLQGYNASIIAYGQTGSGKTFTVEGSNGHNRGLLPRCVESIFKQINSQAGPGRKFLVRASYLQIYNEAISDLIKPARQNLMIREDKRKGIYVENLSEWVVRSPEEVYELIHTGSASRATAATSSNVCSSRSHAIFMIVVEQSETYAVGADGCEYNLQDEELMQEQDQEETTLHTRIKVGKLNLVDLAGSERVRVTGATGQRLEESKKINQSLSALGNVVAALTATKGRQHIPFRDSKLTRILGDSLGGNCRTTLIAMISPALESYNETLSTLKFANRAKNIKNIAEVNLDLDQKALLSKYEAELRQLREELCQRSKNVVDKRSLLEVQEQQRKAEKDKLACITALEEQSRGLLEEKKEKKLLEARIAELQSQLLTGGKSAIRGSPAKNETKQAYEQKLEEIEKERELIEQDKAQIDRYKQLLVKQRDIMVALTSRLTERDDVISSLQEELAAYDTHQQVLEDVLDSKTAIVICMEKHLMEQQPSTQATEKLALPGHTPIHTCESPEASAAPPDSEELARMEEEFQEVEAERSALVYLLNEKLEKMVQVEIEERIQACNQVMPSRGSARGGLHELSGNRELSQLQAQQEQEQAQLTAQILEKERQIRAIKAEQQNTMQQLSGNAQGAEPALSSALCQAEFERDNIHRNYEKELVNLVSKQQALESNWRIDRQNRIGHLCNIKQQCATNDKERVALKTILELKIKGLVSNLSKTLSQLPSCRAAVREVQALQSLVSASAAALGFEQGPN